MPTQVRRQIARLLKDKRRRNEYLTALAMLALVVTLGVAAVLTQQGHAATQEVRVLDCQFDGIAAHTHDDSCFDEDGNLVCPLPEREVHIHDDGCYTEERVLSCGLEEGEEHVHTDECYEAVRTLTCGQDELAVTHVHGPGCFATIEVPVEDEAALAADPDVQPTDRPLSETHPAQKFDHEFKDADGNLVLRVDVDAPEGALPAGTTMVATWVDPDSLSQKQQDAVDAAIAKKADGQVLGSQAVDIEFLDADGAEVEPAVDVTVTLTSALVDTDDQALVVHIDDLTDAQLHQQEQALRDGKSAEEAEPDRTAEALEALSDQALERRDVALADDQLAFESDRFSTYVLAVTSLRKVMQASDGATVTVTVDAPAEAGIPQGAELQVREVAQGSADWQGYERAALGAIGADESELARFFDIAIVGEDGAEVQPAEPVSVEIELADAPEGADASVVHFGAGAELVPATEDAGVAAFDASGFSVWGVVYTVDFHWTANGREFEWSLQGGGAVGLRELLPALGAVDADAIDDFINHVADVTFSDPELVAVEHITEDTTAGALVESLGLLPEYSADLGNEELDELLAKPLAAPDWALVSLKAFDTDEALTITMTNGEVLEIHVTDARQGAVNSASELNGKTFALVGYDNALLTAQKDGDSKLRAQSIDPDNLSESSPQWKFERDSNSGKYRISCDGSYLNINGESLTVSGSAQLLNVSVNNNRIRIANDDGYAVNLYGWDVNQGYGAYRGYPGSNEYFTLYSIPAEIDSNKGYLIYVQEDGKYYVLDNNLNTKAVDTEDELNKLGKEYLWTFEESDEDHIVHTFGLSEPSTLRIYNGQWGVDAESHHTNYLAIDGDANGLIITGFGNPRSSIVFNSQRNRFEISSSDVTEVHLKEQNRYFFTVSSNNPLYGTVGGTDSNGSKVSEASSYLAITKAMNSDGEHKNNNSIQSTPANGYYFDHWELDGEPLDKEAYPQNLADNHVDIPAFGSELKAIFKKIQPPSSTDYPPHETPGYEVLSWLGEALSAKPVEGADKTAEVYDYENRIYRVDLTGHSGVKVIANDVDLAFVTDISNSMLFPEKLTSVKDSGDVDVAIVNNGTNLHTQLESLVSQGLIEHRGIGNPYIVIGDRSKSSTQYAVFYSTGQWLNGTYFESGWWALDASYYARWMAGVITYSSQSNRFFKLSDKNNLHSNDSDGYVYTIYEPNDFWNETFNDSDYLYARDPDNKIGANRLYYLVGSVKLSLQYLQDLANNYPLGAVYTGLETFAGSTKTDEQTIINGTVGESSTWPTRHQDFVQIGGATNYGNTNYDNNRDALVGKLTNITTADGTAQDIAVQQMKNILHWPSTVSNAKKYVVMVTDGAPNRRKIQNGKTVEVPVSEVANAVNSQKGYGGSLYDASLITVGLGINDVPGGQQLLHDIADDGMYYNAQDGNDITLILLDVIRNIMESAVVTSDVHDEIDPAFYPVDKNTGLPIRLNSGGEAYIGLDGEVLSSKPSNGKYGTLTFKDGKWQVDWTNQVFKPEEKGGWKGTLYVKAKEDFMGGIGMETNLGSATMTPKKYYAADEDGNPKGTGQNIPAPKDQWEEDKRTPVEMESPRVNVDELAITEQSSEWTVYLDTTVSPREQLKAIYSGLKVQEVVTTTKDGNHKMNDGQTIYTITENSTADNTTPVSGRNPEEFALSGLPSMGVNDIDWDTLVSTGHVNDIPYVYEGHQAGTFTIELVKKTEGVPEGANNIDDDTGAPPAHTANRVGEVVEEYTLRITYVPSGDNLNKSYHTGSYGTGSAGNTTDESESNNTHVINVYAEPLDVLKVDDKGDVLPGATFGLYRLPKSGESGVPLSEYDSSLTNADGYYLVSEGTSGTDGIVHLAVPSEGDSSKNLLVPGQTYYLIETSAPSGYKRDSATKVVTVETTNGLYTNLAGTTINAKTYPFNWDEGVIIKVDDSPATIVDAQGQQATNGSGQNLTYVLKSDPVTFQTTIVNEKVVVTDINVLKVDDDGEELADAVFQLKVVRDGSDVLVLNDIACSEVGGVGDVTVAVNGESRTYASAFKSTNAAQTITGLPDGDYRLVEVLAPAGHIITVPEIEFTITEGVVTSTTAESSEDVSLEPASGNTLALLTITNAKGQPLPNAGGSGTALFYVVGGLLMAGAAVATARDRRRSCEA